MRPTPDSVKGGGGGGYLGNGRETPLQQAPFKKFLTKGRGYVISSSSWKNKPIYEILKKNGEVNDGGGGGGGEMERERHGGGGGGSDQSPHRNQMRSHRFCAARRIALPKLGGKRWE